MCRMIPSGSRLRTMVMRQAFGGVLVYPPLVVVVLAFGGVSSAREQGGDPGGAEVLGIETEPLTAAVLQNRVGKFQGEGAKPD